MFRLLQSKASASGALVFSETGDKGVAVGEADLPPEDREGVGVAPGVAVEVDDGAGDASLVAVGDTFVGEGVWVAG